MNPNGHSIDKLIALALREDIGKGDITTLTLIPSDKISEAYIVSREEAVVSGLDVAKRVFQKLHSKMKFKPCVKESQFISANTKIAWIKGKTRAILTAERVALNFLSHLSAIATKTRQFVKTVYPHKTKIMDTRKTTPNLRELERRAVRCGGGINHRFNLADMVLIKDNHRQACQNSLSISEMIRLTRLKTKKLVEVEVDNLQQFQQALQAKPEFILLDNMSLAEIKKAVALKKKYPFGKRIELEVSGNVNIHNIQAIAKAGVERISMGTLTHTKRGIDFSLELVS